ncbi:hypothetical protein ACUTJJ_20655 [Agrobacterium sp. DKPNP3]|uniref:hypothetical protein n=1 Tax=Agrobacterium sp. DKPNP3 TaxID=3457323 RepID=UPI00404498D4
MHKKTEHKIIAHENGWAVVISGVIRGVYPSRHMALSAAKELQSDLLSAETAKASGPVANLPLTDAAAISRWRTSSQPTVAVPYQVDMPLRRRSGEVSYPASFDGSSLRAGKI